MPAKKEEKENELRQIENQMRQLGLNSHQEDNFDALIIKLVQGAISKITINLVVSGSRNNMGQVKLTVEPSRESSQDSQGLCGEAPEGGR